MKASAENVFVGANVIKDDKKLLVVKVNAKSMYVVEGWTLEDYNKALALKIKGTTFKEFCEKNKIEMVKYDGYEIEESEAAKKTVVEDSKKAANATSALGRAEKMVLTELLKYKKLHMFANISVGDKIMRVLEQKDEDKFLLNVDNNYILYNSSLDAAYNLCSVFDWGKEIKTVPWEKVTPKPVATAVAQ